MSTKRKALATDVDADKEHAKQEKLQDEIKDDFKWPPITETVEPCEMQANDANFDAITFVHFADVLESEMTLNDSLHTLINVVLKERNKEDRKDEPTRWLLKFPKLEIAFATSQRWEIQQLLQNLFQRFWKLDLDWTVSRCQEALGCSYLGRKFDKHIRLCLE